MNLQDMAQEGQAPEQTSGPKQASPEQQNQFDMLVGRPRQIMGRDAEVWLKALEQSPTKAAVKMGTNVLRQLAMESEKSGYPVDPAVLLHAGVTLVKDIAGIANEAGIVADDQLESFLQQVMQESIAEYMRLDADEGLMPEQGEKSLPGDPSTPDDSMAHEGAESPALEKQEMASEPPEDGAEGMSEEDEMAMQLKNIRGAK